MCKANHATEGSYAQCEITELTEQHSVTARPEISQGSRPSKNPTHVKDKSKKKSITFPLIHKLKNNAIYRSKCSYI